MTEVKDELKDGLKEVTNVLEGVTESNSEAIKKASEIITSAEQERATIVEEEERKRYNSSYNDLQGTKLYVVHFVEYADSKLLSDSPIFHATSPEWAVGFCKSHTDYACKFEDDQTRWWYFYIEETTINESNGGTGWLMTIDWNGQVTNKTYHFDKGYSFDYAKEKIIYEQNNECNDCAKNEKDEETKINEQTNEALKNIEVELKKYFTSKNANEVYYIVRGESDWKKVIVYSPAFANNNVDHYVYDKLTQEYGVGVGNRILFYFQEKK